MSDGISNARIKGSGGTLSAAPTRGLLWARMKQPCSGHGGRSVGKPPPKTYRLRQSNLAVTKATRPRPYESSPDQFHPGGT